MRSSLIAMIGLLAVFSPRSAQALCCCGQIVNVVCPSCEPSTGSNPADCACKDGFGYCYDKGTGLNWQPPYNCYIGPFQYIPGPGRLIECSPMANQECVKRTYCTPSVPPCGEHSLCLAVTEPVQWDYFCVAGDLCDE